MVHVSSHLSHKEKSLSSPSWNKIASRSSPTERSTEEVATNTWNSVCLWPIVSNPLSLWQWPLNCCHSHAKSWTPQVQRSQAQSMYYPDCCLPTWCGDILYQAPDLCSSFKTTLCDVHSVSGNETEGIFHLGYNFDLGIYEGFRSCCISNSKYLLNSQIPRLLGNVQRDLSWKRTLRVTMSLSHPNSAGWWSYLLSHYLGPLAPSCSSCPTIGGWISELENLSQSHKFQLPQ